jgi:hypothetical protein
MAHLLTDVSSCSLHCCDETFLEPQQFGALWRCDVTKQNRANRDVLKDKSSYFNNKRLQERWNTNDLVLAPKVHDSRINRRCVATVSSALCRKFWQ